jgi:hypothetical protein
MSLSISSADALSQWVDTEMTTESTSGFICTGTLVNASTPANNDIPTPTATVIGWRMQWVVADNCLLSRYTQNGV